MMRTAIRALAICFVVACGGGGDGDGHSDESDATLVVEPATAEVMILNGVAATQTYTAKLVWPDGFEKDITAETYFRIDQIFGAFEANTATVRAAGKLQVLGSRNDKSGTAQLIARLKSQRVDPGVPPNTPDIFNAPEDPARAPNVVYPPADVVMPRNLGDFETHWTDPHGNDVFEVSLKTEFSDVRVYVPGGNGIASAGPMPSWTAFLAQEWLDAVGVEGTVSYQVRGVQLANPSVVGAGPPRMVKLSNEQMQGGLYYWAAAAAGAEGIYRHDMSKPGQPAEEFLTKNQTSGRCVACHVMSRDGTRMAITYVGGNGPATIVDVATGARQPETAAWNFATFTPNGNKLLTVFDGTLVVRDSTSQAVLATMAAGSRVSHPDLSPDGTRLVYVRHATARPDWTFYGGQIYTRSYDPTTDAFGPEMPLVTDGVTNFYPSWSPDGQYVLFNRSNIEDDGAGGEQEGSYNNFNASLWVVKADGTMPPVELAAANQALGLTNSWGRWAPFAQTLGTAGEQMYWVTVSSKRAFGTRLPWGRPQIWMMAFRPAAAAAGQDPSGFAFWLPFQNISSSNHIAQWTERVVIPQ